MVFSSGSYPSGQAKNRYLIKHQGVWRIIKTWALKPDWDDEVTDVIWLQSSDMVASWWLMRNGIRYKKRTPIVEHEDLVFLLLQVQDI